MSAVIDNLATSKKDAYAGIRDLIQEQEDKKIRRKMRNAVAVADFQTGTEQFHASLNEDKELGNFERGAIKVIDTPINCLVGMFKGWS